MRRWIPLTLVPLLACGPTFYQAPPTLGRYPERLATKRWIDLFKESLPPEQRTPEVRTLDEACRVLPGELKPLDTAARLARIDELISLNRDGSHTYSSLNANFLHEIRELAADPATFAAAETYLAWRTEHPFISSARLPAERPWNMNEEEFAKARETNEGSFRIMREELARAMADAPPSILPHWKVQEGALCFRSGRYQEAEEIFSSVVETYPGDLRAEVAELMLARCKLESQRLDEAEQLLEEFISHHPKGRFTPDAHGWLGKAAMMRGQFGSAVRHQLDRLDLQPTYEISKTVLRECDSIFEQLLARDDSQRSPDGRWLDPKEDFDAVAVGSHPLVARLFVQHALDPAAAEMLNRNNQDNLSADRWTIDFLKQRTLRPAGFLQTALRDLGAGLLKHSAGTDETTLTVLAWTATESGEHGQALALIDRIQNPQPGDEALHAKAVILQRLGRHGEAVAAFDDLEKRFPESPLLAGISQQRAISQIGGGHAGKAVAALMPPVVDEAETGPRLYPEYYPVQLADTLLQFAPLDQLAEGLDGLDDGSRPAKLLRSAIRTRALAKHDFETARKYLSAEPEEEPVEWWIGRTDKHLTTYLNETGWQSLVAPLEDLYHRLGLAASAREKSDLQLRLARYWFDHRGSITLPGLDLLYYANSEAEKQELLRRQNGLQLGFSTDSINVELDSRDEATHALAHAMEAAKSDDPTIAAPALELANECLFRRAEFSLYQRSRALETDATKLSLEIQGKLGGFPDSTEARRAVCYSFQPATGPWMPGDYNPSNASDSILWAATGKDPGDWRDRDSAEVAAAKDAIGMLDKHPVEIAPGTGLVAIRNQLQSSRAQLEKLRPKLDSSNQLEVIGTTDRLDDLIAAASLDGISVTDFSNYAAGHFGALPPAFESLVDFRERLKTKRIPPDGREIPVKDTAEGWMDFLLKYPQSPKTEAASLRMIRLTARKYRGQPSVEAFLFPEAPIPNGYKRVEVAHPDPSGDPMAILALIDEHEKRFPDGRYRSDLDLLRAASLIDLKKYPEAAVLLCGILNDPGQGDLHSIAALNFCDIAQQLMVPGEREAAAGAFRRNPRAMVILKRLVRGDTFVSRLQPLMPWLDAAL